MPQATPVMLDAAVSTGRHARAIAVRPCIAADIRLSVHKELAAIEQDWRAFEQHADCTVFQTFDWLAAWLEHIGARHGVVPAIVTGRTAAGELLFLLPLAVEACHGVRRLTWLGSDLCDYNGPLLAPDFSQRVGADQFGPLWREINRRLRDDAGLRYDLIDMEKMPEAIGMQPNPFLALDVGLHPSGAYLTHLGAEWEAFYTAKRSSATRRRDRTKLKRLTDFGEVRFVTMATAEDATRALDTLMAQKARSFAAMGVANIFAREGYAKFFHSLAATPAGRELVHVSRLDVGTCPAALNFGLTFRGRYYHVLASYDDGEVSRFGPGRAHLHELLRYAIEHDMRQFDFTVGDEAYKREWSDTEIKLYDYVAPVTLRGAIVASITGGLRRAKRFIKQTPALWSLFSKARSLAGKIGKR